MRGMVSGNGFVLVLMSHDTVPAGLSFLASSTRSTPKAKLTPWAYRPLLAAGAAGIRQPSSDPSYPLPQEARSSSLTHRSSSRRI